MNVIFTFLFGNFHCFPLIQTETEQRMCLWYGIELLKPNGFVQNKYLDLDYN